NQISYTHHEGVAGYYAIDFIRKRNAADVTSNGRYGLKEVNGELLRAISMVYKSPDSVYTVNGYTFCYDQGAFGKTLLKELGEFTKFTGLLQSNGTGFVYPEDFCAWNRSENTTTHQFEYYRHNVTDMVFGSEQLLLTGHDPSAALNIIPFNVRASSLGGTSSVNWNLGGALTVGFGYNGFQKSITVGGDYMHNKSTSEGVLTLIDLNGDGLPDKFFKNRSDKKLYYRKQYWNGQQYLFSDAIAVSGATNFLEDESKSNSFGFEAHLTFYGAGVSGAFNRNKTKSSTYTYFTDMDGDGLPDIVLDGYVYYNRLDNAGNPFFSLITSNMVMVGGSCDSSFVYQDESVDEQMFLPGDTVITTYYERVEVKDGPNGPYVYYVPHSDTTYVQAEQNFLPDHDAVKLWIAPYNGTVNIYSQACLTEDLQVARFASRAIDGVKVSIQQNSGDHPYLFVYKTLFPDTVDYELNSCFDTTITQLSVTRGDRFYFRLESLDKRLYDKIHWSPRITYIPSNRPPTNETKDADGKTINTFHAKEDFLVNPLRRYYISLPGNSKIMVKSDFSIKQRLSANVTMKIYRNGFPVMPARTFPKGNTVAHRLDSVMLNVQCGDSIWFELSCNSNVKWNDIEWNTLFYYTEVADSNLVIWDTYTEPGRALPAILYDNLVPHLTTYPRPVLPTELYTTSTTKFLDGRKIRLINSTGAGTAFLSIKNSNGTWFEEPISFNASGVGTLTLPCLLQANTLYYLDLYTQNERMVRHITEAYIEDGSSKIPLGVHSAQQEEKLIFGDLYQNWGQFSYRKDNPSENKIIESRLVVSQAAQTMPDTNQHIDTADMDLFESQLGGLVYDPLQDFFLMAEPDYKAKRWLGYSNILYFSADTMSNTFSSAPTAIDVTEFPVPHIQYNGPVVAVRKSSSSITKTKNFGVSLVAGGVGYSWHKGRTQLESDFADMNGDRYPDVISKEQVQYSKPQGGLSSLTLGHCVLGQLYDETSYKGTSSSYGASFTVAKKTVSNSKHKMQHEISGSAGLSGCSGYNDDTSERIWLDINGDGLPDRVNQEGEIFYNLGYTYIGGAPWYNAV
ncbi:MAG: hypothetical protein RR034_03910, partial [Bacteroidales bacterium]